jgi:pseudomonalisin
VSAAVPIYLTQGGRFDAADATTTVAVGAATLAFSDCTHGSLDYVFSDGSGRAGSLPLLRSLPNRTCSTSSDDNGVEASDFLLSGTWADLGADGQGVFLELNPPQRYLFGGWFTYDDDGAASNQRWLTLQALFFGDSASIAGIGIYESNGGLFGEPDAPITVQVGSASLAFSSCSAAQLDYQFDAGQSAGTSGSIELVRLLPAPEGCALP